MGTRTAAHVVGSTLASLGVDTVFGLAGSGNFAVTNALVEGGARFHSSRHEGGAVAMADGWARTTGRPGVVSVHQGPRQRHRLTAQRQASRPHRHMDVRAGGTRPRRLRSNFRVDKH